MTNEAEGNGDKAAAAGVHNVWDAVVALIVAVSLEFVTVTVPTSASVSVLPESV